MGKKKHHKKKEAKKAAAPAPAPAPGADGAEASGMSSYLSSMAQQLWGPAAEAAPPAARVLDEVPESWIAAGRQRRLSAALAPAAARLERAIVADRVSAHLDARPDFGDVARLGVHHHALGDCHVFHRRKSALQRAIVGDALNAKLERRDEHREAARRHSSCNVHAHGAVAPRLHGVARRLSRSLAADALNAAFCARGAQKPPPRRRSARLEPAAAALEKQLRADVVAQNLDARPGAAELRARRVLHADDERAHHDAGTSHPARDASGVAGALHARRASLAKTMTKDQLNYLLRGRPDRADLLAKNVLAKEPEICATIEHKRRGLDFRIRRSSLHAKLARRPAPPPAAAAPPPAAAAPPRRRVPPLTDRRRYRAALEATYRLYASPEQPLDRAARAKLKELILEEDERVSSAVETYWLDGDGGALLDTLFVLATFESRQS